MLAKVLDGIRVSLSTRVDDTGTFYANVRSADEIVHDGELYMRRWYLWKNELGSGRIHEIRRPDADRDLHDHPWCWAFSLILSGGYSEERLRHGIGGPEGRPYMTHYKPGDMNLLRPGEYHRITEVLPNTRTLFITGKVTNSWGFLVKGKHVDREEYFARADTISQGTRGGSMA